MTPHYPRSAQPGNARLSLIARCDTPGVDVLRTCIRRFLTRWLESPPSASSTTTNDDREGEGFRTVGSECQCCCRCAPHCSTCTCGDDHDPFAPPGPPMPSPPRELPRELYVKVQTWDRWQGSPTEIARIARRADEWIDWHFTNFTQLPRAAWYLPGGAIRPQDATFQDHTVRTAGWVGGATADRLSDEIEARRELVRGVHIKSAVISRGWPVQLFETVPLREIPPPVPLSPGIHVSTETVAAPHQIEVEFSTEFPAVRLRVIAPSPTLCTNLFEHMQPHVEAGARPRVWAPQTLPWLGAGLGVLIGLVVGLLAEAALGIWIGLFSAYALGTVSAWFMQWTFPPLELVEAWEKSRWSTARTYSWQGALFLIALTSILLTVALASPGH